MLFVLFINTGIETRSIFQLYSCLSTLLGLLRYTNSHSFVTYDYPAFCHVARRHFVRVDTICNPQFSSWHFVDFNRNIIYNLHTKYLWKICRIEFSSKVVFSIFLLIVKVACIQWNSRLFESNIFTNFWLHSITFWYVVQYWSSLVLFLSFLWV